MPEYYDVFLSYHIKDREWVDGLVEALSRRNLQAWNESAEIKAGDLWIEAIENGLRKSRSFVIVITPESLGSNLVAAELGAALALKMPLIPVVSKDAPTEQLPGPIRRRKYLLMNEPDAVAEEICRRLVIGSQKCGMSKDRSPLCAAN